MHRGNHGGDALWQSTVVGYIAPVDIIWQNVSTERIPAFCYTGAFRVICRTVSTFVVLAKLVCSRSGSKAASCVVPETGCRSCWMEEGQRGSDPQFAGVGRRARSRSHAALTT